MSVDTAVDLGGIALRNPVLTASGTFGYGSEFAGFLDLRTIGGFVAKSLTLEPRQGNPPPRIGEAASGMLNAISLENVGVDVFVREKLPLLPEEVVVIASLFGTELDLYVEVAKRLTGAPRVAGLEGPRGDQGKRLGFLGLSSGLVVLFRRLGDGWCKGESEDGPEYGERGWGHRVQLLGFGTVGYDTSR